MKYCECGHRLNETYDYCPFCGRDISDKNLLAQYSRLESLNFFPIDYAESVFEKIKVMPAKEALEYLNCHDRVAYGYGLVVDCDYGYNDGKRKRDRIHMEITSNVIEHPKRNIRGDYHSNVKVLVEKRIVSKRDVRGLTQGCFFPTKEEAEAIREEVERKIIGGLTIHA